MARSNKKAASYGQTARELYPPTSRRTPAKSVRARKYGQANQMAYEQKEAYERRALQERMASQKREREARGRQVQAGQAAARNRARERGMNAGTWGRSRI